MKTRPSSAADCIEYMARKLQSNSDMTTDLQKLHDLLYLALREGFAIVQEAIFEGAFVRLPQGPFCLELEPMMIIPKNLFSSCSGPSNTVKLVLNSVLEQYGFLDHDGIMKEIEKDSAWRQADSSAARNEASVISLDLLQSDSHKINLLRSLWCMNHNTYTDTYYASAAIA